MTIKDKFNLKLEQYVMGELSNEEMREIEKNPSNLEEWILSEVGEEIYQTFIYSYTKKQWGKEPKELPTSIIKRLPIRLNFNDNYYKDEDIYQGVPIGGYTHIIERMITDTPVELNVDFNKDKEYKHIIQNIRKNVR